MMTKQWKTIWKKQYSLAGLTAADQFKSYEDLERRLKYVLGQKSVLQLLLMRRLSMMDTLLRSLQSVRSGVSVTL